MHRGQAWKRGRWTLDGRRGHSGLLRDWLSWPVRVSSPWGWAGTHRLEMNELYLTLDYALADLPSVILGFCQPCSDVLAQACGAK